MTDAAPVIPNEDQFSKLDELERQNVIAPLVEMGQRYKRAFGGWRLLADVVSQTEQSEGLWIGAGLRCREAEDRRGSQFCAIMSAVAPNVRAEVLRALR